MVTSSTAPRIPHLDRAIHPPPTYRPRSQGTAQGPGRRVEHLSRRARLGGQRAAALALVVLGGAAAGGHKGAVALAFAGVAGSQFLRWRQGGIDQDLCYNSKSTRVQLHDCRWWAAAAAQQAHSAH